MQTKNIPLKDLFREAEQLLRKANRNVGRAWRLIEDAKLQLKRTGTK